MSSSIEPSIRARTERPTGGRVARALRWGFALILVIVAALLVVNQQLVRSVEASLVALWMNPLFPRGVRAIREYYLVWLPNNKLVAFDITVECTVLVLIVPLIVLGAIMHAFTRVSWIRTILALVAASLVTIIVNQVRLGVIGWATYQFGLNPGYEISHQLVGSIIGIIGFALGVIVMLVVLGIRPRRRRGRRAA